MLDVKDNCRKGKIHSLVCLCLVFGGNSLNKPLNILKRKKGCISLLKMNCLIGSTHLLLPTTYANGQVFANIPLTPQTMYLLLLKSLKTIVFPFFLWFNCVLRSKLLQTFSQKQQY